MNNEEILRDFASLPPEAQREVADFIAFLLTLYGQTHPAEHPSSSSPAADDFIGMWRDRDDLRDSRAWVGGMRENEWRK
jgi:hypothetical protein